MKTFQLISLCDIESKKREFEINYLPDMALLKDSIEKSGILQPIRVQCIAGDESRRFQIISGFRRYDCALKLKLSQIPAIVENASLDPLSVFASVIEENLFTRPFNVIEKGMILKKLRDDLGMSREEIVETAFPRLGLESCEKIYRFYEDIFQIDTAIQVVMVRNHYPVHLIEDFLRFNSQEQQEFIPYLEALNFSVSALKEFLIWCHEIILRDRCLLKTFLRQDSLRGILEDGAMDRSQKLQKIRDYLKGQRYPRLMGLEMTFSDLKKELGLPLKAPSFFEDDKLEISFSFRDRKELASWIHKINVAVNRQELEKIFEML